MEKSENENSLIENPLDASNGKTSLDAIGLEGQEDQNAASKRALKKIEKTKRWEAKKLF